MEKKSIYRRFIRPFLFLFPAEYVHDLSLFFGELFCRHKWVRRVLEGRYRGIWRVRAAVDCMGLSFRNALGIAAGMDKDGRYLHLWEALGVGFVELGTVTPQAQKGNKRPRLFRLPKHRAIINRMGFNNGGAMLLKRRLIRYYKARKVEEKACKMLIGINIGKMRDTPLASASKDYIFCLRTLYGQADYFMINISSPNTPDIRALQQVEQLQRFLLPIVACKRDLDKEYGQEKPMLLKVSPDESERSMENIVQVVETMGLAGILATNTTTQVDIGKRYGYGGISGAPLGARALSAWTFLRTKASSRLTWMFSGGIDCAAVAKERKMQGAHLLQIYTGLVYAGPSLIERILMALDTLQDSQT